MTNKHLTALKKKLQNGDPKVLERLAADLVSKLVGVRFAVRHQMPFDLRP